tara:strand:+ start:967 stop:1554 length:588 start_codon:yes stop_codon:yes gene_type:complete
MFFQANILDRQIGMDWYSNAHGIVKRIAADYGFSPEQIAGAMAALSPNNKWERNCVDCENLAKAIRADLDPFETKVCTFKKNKAKAIAILMGDLDSDAICDILKGQKVIAFYLNILHNGDTESPCIDGHAFNIWAGTVSGLKDVPSISPKAFKNIQNDYRAAAEIASGVTGETISAGQIQAITWVAYRRIHKGLV